MRTLLLVISLLTLASSTFAGITGVTEAVITTGVSSSAKPLTANLSVVDHRVGTVTFYTEILGYSGQSVEHRWYYRGRQVSSVTINIGSSHAVNWSRSSVAPSQLGEWEARVVDDNGKVLASRSFSVVSNRQSVSTVVQQKQVDSCSVRLGELRKKMSENPTVDYYKFLYDKQVQRCRTNQQQLQQQR